MQTTNTLSFPQTYRPAHPIRALLRAFSAELLKMKRSLALWLTIIAPLLIAGLQLAVLLNNGERYLEGEPDAWLFIARQTLVYWALLMQPLFITLETALVAQLDHSGDHWKQLFSLPLPRWSIYTAKLLVSTLLIALSMAALLVFALLSGALVQQIRPGLGFERPIPLPAILWLFLLAFISSGLLISIHTWVAHYGRSFVVAASFGIFMTTAGVIIINSDWAGYYPWTLTAVLVNHIQDGLPYLPLLGFSCLGAFAIALIGTLLFTHRDVL